MRYPALLLPSGEVGSAEVERMVADRARDMPQVPQTLLIPVGRALSDAITLLAGISLGHTVCPTPADATEREKEKYGLALSPASGGFSVLFTSGTTGDPKAVRLGLEQWRASSHAFAAYHRINPGDSWLLSIPLYHAGGFAILMRALLLGMRVAIPETASTEELRRWMEDERLLGVSVVPTVLRRILDSGPVRLRGRKKILVGGAPAPRALMERALAGGFPVEAAYGATETCAQIAGERVFEGVSVRVADDGEIIIAGPMVAGGCWASGDIGMFDAGSGNLVVSGRKKELINSGGVKVAPAEVEAAIFEIPGVMDCAVWGEADPEWGEAVHAAVVAAPYLDEQQVSMRLRRILSPPKCPKKILFLREIPRNRAGKLDRAGLLEHI